MQPSEITEVLDRPLSRELLARDLTRLGYVAKDGTPRTVPIAFSWNGSQLVMCTTKNAPKVTALRRNPAVALTIDTEVHPPKILLIRGRAELAVVDGIPDEYLEMNGTYEMTAEQRVEWEAEVRSLYDGMVRIVVTPTWAKLIDFETTLPRRSRNWSGGGTNASAAERCTAIEGLAADRDPPGTPRRTWAPTA
jgi:general stress protein 26